MTEIEIHRYKKVQLQDATILNGFPTLSVAGTIAANYLIGSLNMDQVGAFDSVDFPPVSMVYDSKPKFPARIYVGGNNSLAAILSEFTPPPVLTRPIGKTIFLWAEETGCTRIITPEVVGTLDEGAEEDVRIYGVGSTERARKELARIGVKQLKRGMITGVPGVLINEGKLKNFDVISLLAEVKPGFSDSRAAAKLLETISLLLPDIKIDVEPLYEEAEKIEKFIKMLMDKVKISVKGGRQREPLDMYR
ncbi:MAG: proteasome assembly chaperone family protein [Candidatus Hydrothermarchaeaceae archaeon]